MKQRLSIFNHISRNMEKQVIVMIVAPLMGHLRPSLEMAKILLARQHQLSINVLLIQIPIDPEGTEAIRSITTSSATERLRFIYLPMPEDTSKWCWTDGATFVTQMTESVKPHVREAVKNIRNLHGFVIDMINPTMIDIADEFDVPTYLFFTSSSSSLGTLLYFQTLEDEKNYSLPDEIENITEMVIPCFSIPVSSTVFPLETTNKHLWSTRFLHLARRYRRVKAILINTFEELEDYSLKSFTKESAYGKSMVPPIYPIGPILSINNTSHVVSAKSHIDVINWLDTQSPSSVVFLCFGSLGSFGCDQIKEIAMGLERSGHRFVWSFRVPSSTNKGGFPIECDNHAEVLPQGFLDRTSKIGKVVGWVQQLDILSHKSVGGFVSHCGWNSVLESIWCGVPMATWPLSGEQQMNAFQLVREFEIAVEISLDYAQAKEDQQLVKAEEIGNGLKKLMDENNEARKKMRDLSQKSKLAMSEGGSSYVAMDNFMKNSNLIVG